MIVLSSTLGLQIIKLLIMLQYISEDDQLITTLDNFGPYSDGFTSESLPANDVEKIPPHVIPPYADHDHEDLSGQVPVSAEDHFILDLLKE